MDFEGDFEAIEIELFNAEQRIKKLEKHKEITRVQVRESKSENKTLVETLRRLEHNLDELYEKRAFLIKERRRKQKKPIETSDA